jgi:hypothetical protein
MDGCEYGQVCGERQRLEVERPRIMMHEAKRGRYCVPASAETSPLACKIPIHNSSTVTSMALALHYCYST